MKNLCLVFFFVVLLLPCQAGAIECGAGAPAYHDMGVGHQFYTAEYLTFNWSGYPAGDYWAGVANSYWEVTGVKNWHWRSGL